MQMRRLPKPVIAMVAGYAVGGGHILHMVADITVSIALSPAAMSFTAAGHQPTAYPASDRLANVSTRSLSSPLHRAAVCIAAAEHNPLPMATQLDVIKLANLQKRKRLFTVSG